MKKNLEIVLWVAFLAAAGYAVYTFLPKPEESLPEYPQRTVADTPDPALSKSTKVFDLPPTEDVPAPTYGGKYTELVEV
jgi:hypothetical protein